MLGKLMKHEFRATGRIMLPLFLAVLVASICTHFLVRIQSDNMTWLNILIALLMILFILGLIALAVMSIIIMVQRFRSNLLSDEGYLMFTLPTSVHSLVWSKILVSTVWFLAAGLVFILAVFIAAFQIRYIPELSHALRQVWDEIVRTFSLNSVAVIVETVAMILLNCISTCLLFYAALSIGHSFANRKMLLSVVFFFVLVIGSELLLSLLTITEPVLSIDMQTGTAVYHAVALVEIGVSLVLSAIYYGLTVFFLKKRLNLE